MVALRLEEIKKRFNSGAYLNIDDSVRASFLTLLDNIYLDAEEEIDQHNSNYDPNEEDAEDLDEHWGKTNEDEYWPYYHERKPNY